MRKIFLSIFIFLNFFCFAQIHKEDYLKLNYKVAEGIGQNLDISVYIIGPGQEVWAKWGHIGLGIKNLKTGKEVVYDWGIFNPYEKDFKKNFLLGNLNYMSDYSPADSMVRYYTGQKREIYKLNLKLDNYGKAVIERYASESSIPGKNGYAYRFFDNNCSTKIRDIIDMGVNGQIYKKSQNLRDKTIRDLTFLYTDKNFHIEWAFQFILGANLDEKATDWSAMFLPLEVKDFLKNFKYVNEAGETVQIVRYIQCLNKAEGITPVLTEAKPSWLSSLFIGIFVGSLGCVLFLFSSLKKSMRIISGIYMAFISIFFALASLVIFEFITISNFLCTHQNANILYVNPFLFVMFIISILFAGGVKHSRVFAIIGWGVLSLVVTILSFLSIFSILKQNIIFPVLTFAPIYILFFIGLMFAREKE